MIPADLLSRARAKGSTKQYERWLRHQPSALDGGMDYDCDTGMSWCDPCHYRTAKNSGTGCKPEYSALPLTHQQHLLQHRIGTFAFQSRAWWEANVIHYLTRWIEE